MEEEKEAVLASEKKIMELKNKLSGFDELLVDHQSNLEKLSLLYEQGIIDEEGQAIVIDKEVDGMM